MPPRILVSACAAVAGAALLLQPAFGQRGAPAPPAPAPSGSTTGTAPGSTGSIPSTRPPTSETPQLNRPIYIAGRVTLEDGSVPSGQVVIERVCGSTTHSEGYTDGKGYFSIQLGGQSMAAMQDASEPGSPRDFGIGGLGQGQANSGFGGGLGGTSYANCEIRARLAGYRSQTVQLMDRRSLDDPNIGVILLHRLAEGEGSTISAASLAAPKDARKAFDKGMSAVKKNKTDEAVESFQKAVEVYPKYAVAWNELGKLQVRQGQVEAARKSYQSAIEADPKFVEPYLQLSLLAVQGQRWEELADVSDRALKLDPFSYPREYLFNAVAHFNLQHLDQAEKSAREAGRLDTRHEYADYEHLLGLILAQRRDYTGAAEHLRAYLKFRPNARDADTTRTQLEQIEKMQAQAAAAPPQQ